MRPRLHSFIEHHVSTLYWPRAARPLGLRYIYMVLSGRRRQDPLIGGSRLEQTVSRKTQINAEKNLGQARQHRRYSPDNCWQRPFDTKGTTAPADWGAAGTGRGNARRRHGIHTPPGKSTRQA